MLDHTGVVVSDFDKSKAFYSKALSAIGYELLMELPASVTGHADVGGAASRPNRISGSATARRTVRRSTWRSASAVARWSMPSIKRPSPPVAAITGRPVSVLTTMKITTAPSCSIRTVITSRRCVIRRSSA